MGQVAPRRAGQTGGRGGKGRRDAEVSTLRYGDGSAEHSAHGRNVLGLPGVSGVQGNANILGQLRYEHRNETAL